MPMVSGCKLTVASECTKSPMKRHSFNIGAHNDGLYF